MADPEPPPHPRRLLCCSGKIYYDLLAARRNQAEPCVALLRLEQLYPLQEEAIATVAAPLADIEEICWVQEEPSNMGAWTFLGPRLEALFGRPLRYFGRPEAASPATGFLRIHKQEQEQLVKTAITVP